jgi:hypothetical protein
MRARRQDARDPAGPGHAGGAGICLLPRSRRARRERLRAGGPAAALRTCAGPAQSLPAGAATTGIPGAATWMTPTPAGRPDREGCRGPAEPWTAIPHADPAAMVRPAPAATLMVRDSFADVQACRGAGGSGRGGSRWLFRAPQHRRMTGRQRPPWTGPPVGHRIHRWPSHSPIGRCGYGLSGTPVAQTAALILTNGSRSVWR